MINLQSIIEKAWDDRSLLQESQTTDAIRAVIEMLDEGKLKISGYDHWT